MKTVADTLGVARSKLVEQPRRPDRPRRGPYVRAGDDEIIAEIRAVTDARPTYGYRRVAALLNRARRGSGKPSFNHKRVFRLMRMASLLLQPCTGRRAIRAHKGVVIAPASNQRWASDGFEIACWNGEIVRDLMLDRVERRFDALRAPHQVQWLAGNGSPYTAAETVEFAAALNLVAWVTPVRSPESNGVCEAFVKTFKRDYAAVNPRPDAISVLQRLADWFEDYNTIHPTIYPHSGLRFQSPREFIQQQFIHQATCPV